MALDKNTGKSKGFAFLNVPQHVYNELVKLNGIEFQNHFIRIERIEECTTKQTQGIPLNKQNKINNFNRQIKYKINKGLQSGRARFKYFPGTILKTFYTILTEP